MLGWPRAWDRLFPDVIKSAVRIVEKHKHLCIGLAPDGRSINCHIAGKTLFEAASDAELPVVGDWCVLGDAYIDKTNRPAAQLKRILPRRTVITRLGAGPKTETQALASNIDVLFVVTSANREFNIGRLRRYMLVAEHGFLTPVIVISKSDLLAEATDDLQKVLQSSFPGVQSIATSAVDGTGISAVSALIKPGTTAAFLGSSGVGKSTLVNALLEVDVQKTNKIRENDAHGRHTTSGSELFFVRDGGMIIDTAGLREVGLVADEGVLDRLMPSVQELASECRFGDCSHTSEPGCAVLEALESGALPVEEYEGYNKLQREIAYTKRKFDQQAANAERDRWKKITVDNRRRYNER
jgi:ribosome biogenesis GTPase